MIRYSANEQRAALLSGAQQFGIELTQQQSDKLLTYVDLLNKWNKVYNLTAVRDPQKMISRHLLDSLSVLSFIHGVSWIDVGSGGGMPGIPLAILCPDKKFVLLDSNGKKTRFLTQVKIELALVNIEVLTSRVERASFASPADGIISRAFSDLASFTQLTKHLGDRETRWLALKGQYPADELQSLGADFRLESECRLNIPGCSGERYLLILRYNQHKEMA